MAGGDQTNFNNNNNNGKPKKRKYLPHGKPVRKGMYPLRPGVEGFFITCDGGRERQASNEALSLLDTFYEQLVEGKNTGLTQKAVPVKPLNKVIKFKDSDSSDDEEVPAPKNVVEAVRKDEGRENIPVEADKKDEGTQNIPVNEDCSEATEEESQPAKKQCIEVQTKSEQKDVKEKSMDELIEEELKEMGDRKKRHFVSLDSGCNGCIFIQMHKNLGDPGPVSIAQHMMTSAASTRKHMSRFILRVVPVEVTCYASEVELSKAIKPLMEHYFPIESPTPQKFAVLYEARANTGVERMKIIDAIAKSVPEPHKVDLKNPDKTIIVQIAKTICMIGVVEKYKELSKYNLRQLTSPQE